jgi:hypothetical protein
MLHLVSAGVVASQQVDQKEFWASLAGFLLLQGMQVVSLVLGGLLAGAGQRQAAVYGAVLGVWNGVLVTVVQPEAIERFNAVAVYGLPLLHAAVGALAAWVGSVIWRPITPASVRGSSRPLAKIARREGRPWFAGPVRWPRVIMGTGLAVAGALWAGVILDRVVRLSGYALSPASLDQAQLVTWEIMALAILAGGALAGAATRNGMMQGLAVGVCTAIALVAIRMASPHAPTFLMLAVSMFAPVILGVLGGGFGGQLFPPLPPVRSRSIGTP